MVSDFRYSKDLLLKLNQKVEATKDFSSHFIYGKYNFWYVYQQKIFNDIRSYTSIGGRDKEIRLINKSIIFIKNIILGSTLLLVSFLSLFYVILTRKKVVIFGIDIISNRFLKIDKRLAPVYEALQQSRTSYFEIMHTIMSFKTLRNFILRLRPIYYIESLDFVFSLIYPIISKKITFDLSEFSQEEKILIQRILSKYWGQVYLSKLKLIFYKIFLALSSVEKVFLIDDVRNYHEFVLACRHQNILTYAIQHGHFTPYHIGFLKMNLNHDSIKPDKLILWSEFWKKELLRLNTIFSDNELIIGGYIDNFKKYDAIPKGNISYLMVPYERDLDKEIVMGIMRKVSECDGWKVIFKLRDGYSFEEQYAEYGFTEEDKMKIIGSSDTKGSFEKARIVAGVYSTILYDSLLSGKQVAVIETGSPYKPEALMHYNLCDIIDSKKDICEQLQLISSISQKEIERRSNELRGLRESSMKDFILQII